MSNSSNENGRAMISDAAAFQTKLCKGAFMTTPNDMQRLIDSRSLLP